MTTMERFIDQYDLDHNKNLNVALHIISIPLLYIGLTGLLWLIPDDLIKSWLGDRPFANWATVFTIIMLVYYGSESFSMTFPIGGFLLGCLFLNHWIAIMTPDNFWLIPALVFCFGLLITIAGHIMEGNVKAVKKDFQYIIIAPAWVFRFVFQRLGIPL